VTSQVTTEKALNALPTFEAVCSQRQKTPHEKYVVHGHTPLAQGVPDVQANRIKIDTALVFGGRLTAAVFGDLRAEAVDLLQVEAMSLEQQI
jgi:hypothetical protein